MPHTHRWAYGQFHGRGHLCSQKGHVCRHWCCMSPEVCRRSQSGSPVLPAGWCMLPQLLTLRSRRHQRTRSRHQGRCTYLQVGCSHAPTWCPPYRLRPCPHVMLYRVLNDMAVPAVPHKSCANSTCVVHPIPLEQPERECMTPPVLHVASGVPE